MRNVVFQIGLGHREETVAAVVVLQMGLGREVERPSRPEPGAGLDGVFHQCVAQAAAAQGLDSVFSSPLELWVAGRAQPNAELAAAAGLAVEGVYGGLDGSELALESSQRGYVMESGEIILTDDSAKLLENPRVREAYLGE